MAAKRTTAKRVQRHKKRRFSVGTVSLVLALALAVILAWRLHGLHVQVAAAQAELDSYTAQVEELQEANESLRADLSAGATQDKMEDIARDELGLLHKDEHVFYHTGG